MKEFHIFDSNNYYSYSVDCYPNPEEPGNYLNPPNSTDVDLPPLESKKWPKFELNSWVLIPDFRGDQYYDSAGEAVIISDFGAVPDNLFLTPPEPSLERQKQLKNLEIKQAVSLAIVAGIENNALGFACHYPTTISDQINLNGLITESLLPGSGDDYKFWCSDEKGVWLRRNHTKSQIQEVGKAVANHVKAQQENYAKKLTEITFADADILATIHW